MRELNWYCPAVDRQISDDICRKYQCAGRDSGAPETLRDLQRWLQMTHRYENIDAFHRVCAGCVHGQQRRRA